MSPCTSGVVLMVYVLGCDVVSRVPLVLRAGCVVMLSSHHSEDMQASWCRAGFLAPAAKASSSGIHWPPYLRICQSSRKYL